MAGFIIGLISAIVSGVLVYVLTQVIKENRDLKKKQHDQTESERSAISKGLRGILKKELKEIYVKYENSSTIPADDYETWTDMFEAYEGLHGNGTFKRMDGDVKKKHIV